MMTVASSRPTFSSSSSSAAAGAALEAPKPVEVLAPKLKGLTAELAAAAAKVDEDPRLPNEKPPVEVVVVVAAEDVDEPNEVDGDAAKENAGVTFSAASGLDAPNEKPPVLAAGFGAASSFLAPNEKALVVAAGLAASSFLVAPNEKPPVVGATGLGSAFFFFLSSLLVTPNENPVLDAGLFADPFVGVEAVVEKEEAEVVALAGC